MAELFRNQYVGLKTEYETPHVCGNCMEHIAADWSFCPECGEPTGITAKEYEEYMALLDSIRWNTVPGRHG